ncbi:mannose/fructose/sorbose PTS transporter subunit IIB [Vagococcus elongatus]|uniref:PTS system mannose-specific EIIAB component n=1 Tax=Vagococcus elongatus TaxID=180344 RepID=A0A430AY82_9ENTE|nr:mannose/fructose/sorbose PTS transporter subunit IIB [Vagococcus elongatus]RSU13031.1 PTS mannose transporter subunit IIAB [Vagococcus elongatus]
MVGIILASHGEFAEGILQSGTMIFGEQEKVAAVTLMPSEGPEDLRKKIEDAIASFGEDNQVLFLVDMWGGTPFNQANHLLSGNEDKWAVVSGLNLPMLIETFASRLSMDSAHEIATHIIDVAKDGVKVKPESLEPATPAAAAVEDSQPKGALPPGTVVGDGKLKIVLTRVDSRLLHGQVSTAWTKSVGPNRIIVVSDDVAKDDMRKKLIEQAAPPGVKANVIPIKKMIEIYKDPRFGGTKALLLFENPQDVMTVVEGGVDIKEVNVGSMAHSVGKVVVSKVLSMGHEDVESFEQMKAKGITFDVRKVPNDAKDNMDEILNKAKNELGNVK